MEHTVLHIVGMLGLDFILVATVALFALHAIESWRSRGAETDTREQTANAVNGQVHDFPLIRHAEAGDQHEEPTRRAA